MSVTITTYGFNPRPIKARSPFVLDNKYKPNIIMIEWTFSAWGVGDASGGLITSPLDFSDLDLNLYHYITSIYSYNSQGDGISLSTHTDRWENFLYSSHANIPLHFFCAKADEWLGLDHRDQLSKPLYLGKTNNNDDNPGLCDIYWKVNGDGKYYTCIIQGFSTLYPSPLSTILQP